MHRSPESPDSSQPDEQPNIRRYRAATMEEALDAARAELGSDIEVIEANRIRRGGVGGFFATDLGIELSVAAQPGMGTQPAVPTTAHDADAWSSLDNSAALQWEQQPSAPRPAMFDDEFIDPLGASPAQPAAVTPTSLNPTTLHPTALDPAQADAPTDRGPGAVHRSTAQPHRSPAAQIAHRPAAFDTFERTTELLRNDARSTTAHPTRRAPDEAPPVVPPQQPEQQDEDLMQHDVGDFEQIIARIGRESEARHTEPTPRAPSTPGPAGTGPVDTGRTDSGPVIQTEASEPVVHVVVGEPASMSDGVAQTLASIEAAPPRAEQQHADLEAAEWLERTLSGFGDGDTDRDPVLEGLSQPAPAPTRPAAPSAEPAPSRTDSSLYREPIPMTPHVAAADDTSVGRTISAAAPAPAGRPSSSPSPSPSAAHAPAAATAPAVTPARAQAPAPQPLAAHSDPRGAAGADPHAAPAPIPATTSAMDYAIGLTQNAAGGLIAQLAAVDAHRGSPMADIKTLSVSVTMPDGAVVDFTAKLDTRDR